MGGGIQDKSHVITSSYNHLIIMRTHRWPMGLVCIVEYRDDINQQQKEAFLYFSIFQYSSSSIHSRGLHDALLWGVWTAT